MKCLSEKCTAHLNEFCGPLQAADHLLKSIALKELLFYFYLFIYLFNSDSRSITKKKKHTNKKTKQNKTAKTAQNDSNSKI